MSENHCESDLAASPPTVRVFGEVDLSWSQTLRDAILSALKGGNAVAVDLAAVSYIDSSGIAALVEGFQTARQQGKRFGLIAVSPAVLSVLQLARLDKVFPLYHDAAGMG